MIVNVLEFALRNEFQRTEDFLELVLRDRVDGIAHPNTVFAYGDDPAVDQFMHMMAQGRLADREFLQEIAGAAFLPGQRSIDGVADRIPQRLEDQHRIDRSDEFAQRFVCGFNRRIQEILGVGLKAKLCPFLRYVRIALAIGFQLRGDRKSVV